MTVAVWTLGLLALGTLFARRTSGPVAAGYAVIAFLGIELLVLLVNPLLRVPLPWTEAAVWTIAVVFAIVHAVRAPRSRPTLRTVLTAVAAASGAAILVASLALAQVLPGALRIEWAMNSDAVNVVVFSRELLEAGGISPQASETPTPLPYAMVASAAAPGRATVADASLAAHDITALAAVWVFMLAVCAVLAGAVVAAGAHRARTAVAVILTAAGSILTLSWYVLGVQFQFGFVTVAFSIALLLASWLVYLDGRRRPVLALTALIVATAATFAVWSPLVVCIVPLGIVLLVRSWHAVVATGWRGLLAPAGATAFVLVYLGGFGLPVFLRASPFLSADGGFPPIGPGTILAVLGLTGATTALAARLGRGSDALTGILALGGGFTAGLAFLLAQRFGFDVIWGYYPAKFSWTVSIVLIVIALGAVGALLENATLARPVEIIATVSGGMLIAGLMWAPTEPQDPLGQMPLVGILRGDALGLVSGQADAVLPHTGQASGTTVFWGTPYDRWANLWLLQLHPRTDDDGLTLRALAYAPGWSTEDLCTVARLVDGPVTVFSANPEAADLVREACPDERVEVVPF